MISRIAVLALLVPSLAIADEYKMMDEARVAIIEALDKGDAKTFATYLGPALEVKGLWFDTPACRKKFSTARVTAKTAPAFVACISPLHVFGRGLNVYYGPEVLVSAKIDVIDGKARLQSIRGELAVDPTLPQVWRKGFEEHRTAGDPIVLDADAKAELAEIPDTGAVIHICVNAAGKVAKTSVWGVDKGGPTAKLVANATKSWTFKPFTVRDKPSGACSTITAK